MFCLGNVRGCDNILNEWFMVWVIYIIDEFIVCMDWVKIWFDCNIFLVRFFFDLLFFFVLFKRIWFCFVDDNCCFICFFLLLINCIMGFEDFGCFRFFNWFEEVFLFCGDWLVWNGWLLEVLFVFLLLSCFLWFCGIFDWILKFKGFVDGDFCYIFIIIL